MAILHKRSGHEIKKFAALLLIIIVGFSFRIYRIGEDNLWNDELGQLYASTQPTLIGIFQAIQKHVMAMPLDYLMTRLVSYISVSDFMLRVPSLIWSTVSLIVFFFFL
ncbi:MAG: hypothetical protein M5U34_33350 [Chloroflexi bacterium]|nr:hypothetical protein [Chloroflexota bacterium]